MCLDLELSLLYHPFHNKKVVSGRYYFADFTIEIIDN